MINSANIKIFTVLVLLVIPHISNGQNSSDSLVGVWQDARIVASGWSNTFLFFNDGSFKYFYSQMDCSKRTVSISGKWKVNGDEMDLTVEQKTVIEGGHLVPSNGSCGTDSMIIDGVERTMKLEAPEEIIYSVSELYADTQDDIARMKVYIDAMPYWRFSDKPGNFLNEFEQ